jgi:hypothetical protein
MRPNAGQTENKRGTTRPCTTLAIPVMDRTFVYGTCSAANGLLFDRYMMVSSVSSYICAVNNQFDQI